MNAFDRVCTARSELLLDEPFFGFLALRLVLKETEKCVTPGGMPTMATDGKHLFFHPDAATNWTDAELKAVVCHEVMHCSNGHPWRRGGRQQGPWNKATDYSINPFIEGAGHKLPGRPLLDAKYSGKAAEEIYPLMPQEKEGDKGGEGEEGEGHQHGPGCGGGCVVDYPEGKGESMDAQEAEIDWQLATRQAAMVAQGMGKLPAGMKELVDELLRPKMDWKSLLRQFVQTAFTTADFTWRAPSRRYVCSGLYLPSMHSEQYPPMVVGEDTSGSISMAEATMHRSEVKAIVEEVQPETLYWMQCDAKVQKVTEFNAGDDFVLEQVYGRGGTDFRPVFQKVEEMGIEPACLIYFTDTFGTYPEEAPAYPVLWVVRRRGPDHRVLPAPFGEMIFVEE